MLVMYQYHCQMAENKGCGQAGRQTVRRTQSMFSITGRHWELSLNHPSLLLWPSHHCSSCIFVFVSPSSPPTPTSLSLSLTLLPFSACAELWSSDEWKMYYSVAPSHRHTHIQYARAWVFSFFAWLSFFAVGPSLNEISWVYHISVSG